MGVDISRPLLDTIKQHFPAVRFCYLDLLSKKSLKSGILADLSESHDVAVCNPPFLNHRNDKLFRDLCHMTNLKDCRKMSIVTSDVIFLLHNLRLLKKGGALGIILPDGLITGEKFRILRQSLLSNHRIEAVIQLPDNSFAGIEARTHILILRKDMTSTEKVKIMRSGASSITEELEVDVSGLEQRMDYSYWRWRLAASKAKALTLAEIGADINRGTRPRAFFESSGIEYFHTIGLPVAARPVNFPRSRPREVRMAESQDILTARVGKRCIGRTVLVNRGSLPITDCIYRIRIPECWVNKVWQSFNSDSARDWFSAHSHGVCAQVISKSDLLNFPVDYCREE